MKKINNKYNCFYDKIKLSPIIHKGKKCKMTESGIVLDPIDYSMLNIIIK